MPRALPVVLLLLIGSALTLAACGSSSTERAARSARPQFLAYVNCMRSHGVPNLPDPGPGGGIQLGPSSGIDPSSPAFEAAQARCTKLMPGAQPGEVEHPSERVREQLLAVSKCMRADGISGFPDPTLAPPPSSPQDFSIAMGSGGVSLLVPKTIDVSSPAFNQAAATCHLGTALGKGQRTLAP